MISLLHTVIKHHRGSAAAEDAMQVDSVSSGPVPALPVFLFTCVSYATSPAPLRLALRQHMPAAEDVMVVLEVLDGWISEWNAFSLKLVPSMVVKNPKGVTIARPQRIVKAGTPLLHLVRALSKLPRVMVLILCFLGYWIPSKPPRCFLPRASPTSACSCHPSAYMLRS